MLHFADPEHPHCPTHLKNTTYVLGGTNMSQLSRRTFLNFAALAAVPAIPTLLHANPISFRTAKTDNSDVTTNEQTQQANVDPNLEFLAELQERCYRFFIEAAHPATGLVSDRARTDGSWNSQHSSSASCGFALVSHSIAAKSGWGSPGEARHRTEALLDSMLNVAEVKEGFFYHFMDASNGKRSFPSEISSIDTAIMIAGAMTAAMAFKDDKRIVDLSNQICDRVNWEWMLNGSHLFSMGWTPEFGFLHSRWDRFSELLLLVLIGMGASENAAPPEIWNAWRREDALSYNGKQFLSYPPLFVHQYPHAFFDFRNVDAPSGRNYWENSVTAHEAHQNYLSELGNRQPGKFGHYDENLWGLTSSDSSFGYVDWGGPYRNGSFAPERGMDGTIVPSAAGGALPMVPEAALRTLRHQRDKYGDRVFGRYGFANAFNPRTGWVGSDVIGIDTGITLIQAENHLSGDVWKHFMQHPIAQRGLAAAGFKAKS